MSGRKAGCGACDAALLVDAGAAFAGFTGTKVHILTAAAAAAGVMLAAPVYLADAVDAAPRDKHSLSVCWERMRRALPPGAQFTTCFTGTKVQMLACFSGAKSTNCNTDALPGGSAAECAAARVSAMGAGMPK